MKAAALRWRNWAGNQACAPIAIERPGTDAELVAIVKEAAAGGHRVKVVGAGHSFTDIACTDGVQVSLDNYGRLLHVDRERGRVTAQAGIRLSVLNEALAARGLALENLGDIAYQSIAGAISTSTHGTGAAFGGLATQVVGLDLISADGTVITSSAEEEPDIFQSARVGLGALGVVSAVTLQCVPGFNLRAVEEPMRIDHVIDHLDEYVADNDHFEFFWVPHTGWALTKRNNRTTDPAGGRSRLGEFRDQVLLENVAFGAVCRVGRVRPSWIPRLSRVVPNSGRTEYVERSYRVFTSPRHVHFYEMEYSIPRQHVVTALNQVMEFVNRSGLHISFPVEVRFTAPDDIPLSTATERPSAYIAVHVYRGLPYEQYFRGVEAIMDGLDGRPHWGKLHYQTAATLAPKYPQWERWQAVRRKLDPEGRFAN
ncbi:MAG TPA: D-arabinono-1,4-lactone oxidase, partial [Acidimicrobiales bacterium]|nr:D-arabinono-1,4-lactone oxidase [Acidimicrobiales bacterium]